MFSWQVLCNFEVDVQNKKDLKCRKSVQRNDINNCKVTIKRDAQEESSRGYSCVAAPEVVMQSSKKRVKNQQDC